MVTPVSTPDNTQVNAPATDAGAQQPMTDAERLEALSKLSPDNLELFGELLTELERPDVDTEAVRTWFEFESARRSRAKSRQNAATAAKQAEAPTSEPKAAPEIEYPQVESMCFAEPERYLQPIGQLARYTFAHLLMGEFGQRLFGDDYLDADHFEKLHGLYIDIRAGIASGFPGIDLDLMRDAVHECENKFWI